ncbi:MAG: hypothetical protein AAGB14_11645 [Verrucomicrobiota bacterium]
MTTTIAESRQDDLFAVLMSDIEPQAPDSASYVEAYRTAKGIGIFDFDRLANLPAIKQLSIDVSELDMDLESLTRKWERTTDLEPTKKARAMDQKFLNLNLHYLAHECSSKSTQADIWLWILLGLDQADSDNPFGFRPLCERLDLRPEIIAEVLLRHYAATVKALFGTATFDRFYAMCEGTVAEAEPKHHLCGASALHC